MTTTRVRAFAPASVSNLGPGFDVIGLALPHPGDVVEAELVDRPGVEIAEITGDNGRLSADPARNVAGVVAAHVLSRLRRAPEGSQATPQGRGVRLRVHKQMPLASGLGSSAASSAAAAVAVNELLGRPLSRHELIESALEGEQAASGARHADNVAPALLGGIVLIRSTVPLDVVPLPVPPELLVIVVHPHHEVATSEARALLRERRFSIGQVTANVGNFGALVSALYRGDLALLGRAVDDHIVEPLRAGLIPGFAEVKAAALEAGALACSISGAGPSMFAFADDPEKAAPIAGAMCDAFRAAAGLASDIFIGPVNTDGARLIS